MISDAHKENLEASMSHLAQALDMIKITTVSTRNISTTQTHSGRGQGRGRGRGHDRGNARGGRFGRGGRGRGRGRGGRGPSAFDPNDPCKSYSPKDWRTLSIKEQAMCRAARAENPGGGARHYSSSRSPGPCTLWRPRHWKGQEPKWLKPTHNTGCSSP